MSRYYYYISDAKLDMLFGQITPTFLDGIKVEVGFDFGALKGKLSGDKLNAQAREAKVRAVEKFLEREIMETPQESKWLRASYNASVGFIDNCPGLVLFGGTLGGPWDGYSVMLCGSSHHLISKTAGTVTNDIGWSFVPHLLHSINSFVERYDAYDIDHYEEWGKTVSISDMARRWIFDGIAGNGPFNFLARFAHKLPGPSMRISTLCRVFCVNETYKLVLGSPLYVYD